MEYSLNELMQWNEKIEDIAERIGLECYEQEFEICDFEDMIGYEAYVGMPSHYPHWSFGKSYEKIKTLHKYDMVGLPYEMVINSNPCIAYLMKNNSLLLQILTMSHVYGHNDFFKNNRLFKTGTQAEYSVEMFKNNAKRIRRYIEDPTIGYRRVEKVLNAAHAIKFQTSRVVGEKRVCNEEHQQLIMNKINKPRNEYAWLEKSNTYEEWIPKLNKVPVEPEEDILLFISEYGRLDDWERDIIEIVREETAYFIPQIETKIMNEGWASFIHYTILNELCLPEGLHIEFLKAHNQVIRPHKGSINPYYIGFMIFSELYHKHNEDFKKILEIRALERDESFLRRYLNYDLCNSMNLFEYLNNDDEYIVSEVSDEEGWKKVRDALANSVGFNRIPIIKVNEFVHKDNTLFLEHEYNGKELNLYYANRTLKHINDLWQGRVMISTITDSKRKIIVSDE